MNDIKASVTLTGPIDVLAKLLASLSGGVSVVTAAPSPMTLPVPAPVAAGEDDESGDTAVAPGTVDKNGIPWDDRIHSTPAKLTGKGVWRAKRSVSDELTAQVEAELRARAGQPAPAPVMTMPPMPTPMPMPAPVMTAPPVTMPPGYPAPAPVMTAPPPPAPAPVAAAPIAAPTDFNSFMIAIQSLINSGRVDAAYFGDLVQRVNAAAGTQFGAITDVASRPDLIPWVWSVMQQDGRA